VKKKAKTNEPQRAEGLRNQRWKEFDAEIELFDQVGLSWMEGIRIEVMTVNVER
jgi:hypothetical protein